MMEALLAVWMVGLVGLHRAQGYSAGAPGSTCTTMLPDHGTNTLTGTPYSIVTNSSTFTSGTKVKVTIVGTFKGYFLQARIPDTATIVGTWDTPPTGNKFVQCNSVANDAMTHSSRTSKTNLSLYWIPPTTNPPSSVVFVATVVKTEPEWQMNVQSAKVNASGYVATTKPPAQTTTKPPAQTTTKPPAKTTTKPPAKTTAKPPAKTTTKSPVKTTAKPPAKTTTKPPAKTTAKPPAKTTTKSPVKTTAKPPAKTTAKPPATTTTKPGNSAGRAALAMSGFSLGALLVVFTAACCR
ncbi:transcriptional regulatory protein AlgP-like isoform X1 [Lethenteron reissneri]|uniref:transcriptional regulatory protein AlgP-like isoform X1 n=1 Tax=Lethenteron reissneri TaxID=7753 RepID=UPI002AB6397D|nr:transcriptional regulatory protein AlgP-like isoform X1 [Lethenteron reissneri]